MKKKWNFPLRNGKNGIIVNSDLAISSSSAFRFDIANIRFREFQWWLHFCQKYYDKSMQGTYSEKNRRQNYSR